VTDALSVIETYSGRLSRRQAAADDPDVAKLVRVLQEKLGTQIVGIMLYGSYLRGARDTLLDFYVVVDSSAEALGSRIGALAGWLLPPNVYYLAVGEDSERVRAKYAVVTLAQLRRQVAMAVHPYLWARFAQPCSFVYLRDRDAKRQLLRVCEQSVRTFVKRVAPMVQGLVTAEDFWSEGFSLTYRAELRAESVAKVSTLFQHHAAYYSLLLKRLADGQHVVAEPDGRYRTVDVPTWPAASGWVVVFGLGKLLSVARLIKGAFTFQDPVDYILWKIERHSGIAVQANQRQRRYPLIFAWPLFWRLYRQGAFR
jgi:hypothetical protein